MTTWPGFGLFPFLPSPRSKSAVRGKAPDPSMTFRASLHKRVDQETVLSHKIRLSVSRPHRKKPWTVDATSLVVLILCFAPSRGNIRFVLAFIGPIVPARACPCMAPSASANNTIRYPARVVAYWDSFATVQLLDLSCLSPPSYNVYLCWIPPALSYSPATFVFARLLSIFWGQAVGLCIFCFA
jgi:hypothetical protein